LVKTLGGSDLIHLFNRLDIEATTFNDAYIPTLNFTAPKQAWNPAPVLPSFSNLGQARDSLFRLMNWLVHFANTPSFEPDRTNPCSSAEIAEQQVIVSELRHWSVAFEALVDRSMATMKHKELRAVNLYRAYHRIIMMMAAPALAGTGMAYDDYIPEFQDIVRCIGTLVEYSAPTNLRSRWSSEMGLMPPLYFTATSCRDPVIRRRAIALLEASPGREGLWDGVGAARVAERIMCIEEEGIKHITTCKDIPKAARVLNIPSMAIDRAKQSIKFTAARRDEDGVLDLRMESVSW